MSAIEDYTNTKTRMVLDSLADINYDEEIQLDLSEITNRFNSRKIITSQNFSYATSIYAAILRSQEIKQLIMRTIFKDARQIQYNFFQPTDDKDSVFFQVNDYLIKSIFVEIDIQLVALLLKSFNQEKKELEENSVMDKRRKKKFLNKITLQIDMFTHHLSLLERYLVSNCYSTSNYYLPTLYLTRFKYNVLSESFPVLKVPKNSDSKSVNEIKYREFRIKPLRNLIGQAVAVFFVESYKLLEGIFKSSPLISKKEIHSALVVSLIPKFFSTKSVRHSLVANFSNPVFQTYLDKYQSADPDIIDKTNYFTLFMNNTLNKDEDAFKTDVYGSRMFIDFDLLLKRTIGTKRDNQVSISSYVHEYSKFTSVIETNQEEYPFSVKVDIEKFFASTTIKHVILAITETLSISTSNIDKAMTVNLLADSFDFEYLNESGKTKTNCNLTIMSHLEHIMARWIGEFLTKQIKAKFVENNLDVQLNLYVDDFIIQAKDIASLSVSKEIVENTITNFGYKVSSKTLKANKSLVYLPNLADYVDFTSSYLVETDFEISENTLRYYDLTPDTNHTGEGQTDEDRRTDCAEIHDAKNILDLKSFCIAFYKDIETVLADPFSNSTRLSYFQMVKQMISSDTKLSKTFALILSEQSTLPDAGAPYLGSDSEFINRTVRDRCTSRTELFISLNRTKNHKLNEHLEHIMDAIPFITNSTNYSLIVLKNLSLRLFMYLKEIEYYVMFSLTDRDYIENLIDSSAFEIDSFVTEYLNQANNSTLNLTNIELELFNEVNVLKLYQYLTLNTTRGSMRYKSMMFKLLLVLTILFPQKVKWNVYLLKKLTDNSELLNRYYPVPVKEDISLLQREMLYFNKRFNNEYYFHELQTGRYVSYSLANSQLNSLLKNEFDFGMKTS